MKNISRISFFCCNLLCVFLLLGCSDKQQVDNIQQTLYKQQEQAEHLATEVALAIEIGSLDSLRSVSDRYTDVLFYLFDNSRLVYWSDNRISAANVMVTQYNTWWYGKTDNTHVVGRWTRAKGYNILTLIPIKYTWKIQTDQLQNIFIPPFKADAQWAILRHRINEEQKSYPICSADGEILFFMLRREEQADAIAQNSNLLNSYSYNQLFVSESERRIWNTANMRLRIFYILFLILFLGMTGWGVYLLFKYKGFFNMRLRTKFLYTMVVVVLFMFGYLFLSSVSYSRHNYKISKTEELKKRGRYIQSALQTMYYWDLGLSVANMPNMNLDLREMSKIYETDIHVYDLHGNLVGSSIADIFDLGLISTRLSSDAFFANNEILLKDEQLGRMVYQTVYLPFYNGAMMQIGYIAIPLYVSQEELNSKIDEYLARLFPPYFIVLLLTIIASWLIARTLTSPIGRLTEQMRQFQIGRKNNRLEYKYSDEVGDLVQRYNDMVEIVETSATRLATAERESAWRTMARQIAHEINNPLTPMKLRIQQLLRLYQENDSRFDDYFAQSADLLVDQIDDLSRIAGSFSTFAKVPQVQVSEVDIAQKLTTVIDLFRSNPDNIPIRYIGQDNGVMALADAEQISEVFSNILKNATQALAGQSNADIIVILKTEQKEGAEWVRVSVSDNGAGIDEQIRERIFNPNFTTKTTGAGLGLAISKNIVEGAGGKICFETSEKGTTFFVYLRKKQ